MNVKQLLDYWLNQSAHISNELTRPQVLQYLNTGYSEFRNEIISLDYHFFDTVSLFDIVSWTDTYFVGTNTIQSVIINDVEVERSYFWYHTIKLSTIPTSWVVEWLKITYQDIENDLRFANWQPEDVLDNWDWTVSLLVDFMWDIAVDDEIIIEWTIEYNWTFTVLAVWINFITITATYVAETLATTSMFYWAESTVKLPPQYHEILRYCMIPYIYQHYWETDACNRACDFIKLKKQKYLDFIQKSTNLTFSSFPMTEELPSLSSLC